MPYFWCKVGGWNTITIGCNSICDSSMCHDFANYVQ